MFNSLDISPTDLERKQRRKGERKRGKGRKWRLTSWLFRKKCNPDYRSKKAINRRIIGGNY